MPHSPIVLLAFLISFISFSHTDARLSCTTKEAKELYRLPLYSYPGKDDFEKQNIHIKDETVIMLCYIKESVQMMVYWKSGLSVAGAEEFMKQNGDQWSEQKAEGYDDEIIRKHDEDPTFRLTPYLKQLRIWKNTKGDLAFFDSFRHELVIQAAALGSVKREVPNQDYYLKLRSVETKPVEQVPSKSAKE